MSPSGVGRPWERPETEFPAVVPVGTLRFEQTEASAVAVSCVLAYSHGFEFFVTRLLRPDDLSKEPTPSRTRLGPAARENLEIGLEFANGSRAFATDVPPPSDEEATGPVLLFSGGVGSAYRSDYRWWAWPLPPSGRLDFICRLGATETRVSIEAQLILDASHQSTRAWPNA